MQILKIIKWARGKTEAKWIHTEKQLASISFGTLPFIGNSMWKKIFRAESVCFKKYGMWQCICKNLKINECIYLRELAYNPNFMPNKSKILECWASKELVSYSQLTINTINSFEVISSNMSKTKNMSLNTYR